MSLKPCIVCSEPTTSSRCPEHTIRRVRVRPTSRARGYDARWDRLSKRARKLQPFCTDCGTTEDLQADHSPEAWRRKEQGKAIRLQDIDVVCAACNRARGKAKGTTRTLTQDLLSNCSAWGITPGQTPPELPPDSHGDRYTLDSFQRRGD